MKVIATPVKSQDLKPGDLFSTAGPEYWDFFADKLGVGERVYIRTCTETPKDQYDENIYRITIEANHA